MYDFRSRRLAALALAAALAAGCSRNVDGPLLTPTGERAVPATGVITGQLTFSGGAHPQALVLFARVSNPTFHSLNTAIHVVGSFNTPAWTPTAAPNLVQLAPGAWIDTLSLPLGAIQWKFRTNDDWDPDYGHDPAQPDGLAAALAYPAPGGDAGNLKANVPASLAAQPLVCSVIETPAPTRFAFQVIGAPGAPAVYSSTVDGRFTVTRLVPGTYNVLVRTVDGERRIDGVHVGSGTTDLGAIGTASYTITASAGTGGTITPSGSVNVAQGANQAFTITADASYAVQNVTVDGTSKGPITSYTFTNVTANHTIAASFTATGPLTGGIAGTFTFDPSITPDITGPPWPPVALELLRSGAVVDQVTTPKSSNAFSFAGLAAGSYRLRWRAHQYVTDSLDVTVATTVVAQDVTLAFDVAAITSNIYCSGAFNGFSIADSTQMTQTAVGVWTYDPGHPVAAGTYALRFVTDGFVDNPSDYGGNPAATITVPVTDADCAVVAGASTNLTIQIPTTDHYLFQLDERRLTFSVVPAPVTTGALPSRSFPR